MLRLHSSTLTAGVAPATAEPTVYEIDARKWRPSPSNLLEVWTYRDVLLAFTIRHIKVRYKQAVIGIGWGILQPVLASLLFAIFLGRFVHLPSDGIPYFVFALAGMALWMFFSTALLASAESLIRDSSMVRKVYFPRQILPLAAIGAALVDLPPALAVFIVADLVTGGRPSWTWLLIPLPVFLIVLAATALGLMTSALNVYYRDVRHALPFLLQVILFSSPVVYALGVVPVKWRQLYEVLNPLAAAIQDLRLIVLHDTWPNFWVNAGALAWLLTLLVAGYYVFKSLERDFADRL